MLSFALAACAMPTENSVAESAPPVPQTVASAPTAQTDARIVFPASVSQGALVFGKVPPGSKVTYAGRALRVSGYGTVVFGVGRDEKGPLEVEAVRADGNRESASIAVTPRDWPIEQVKGVPPATVNPPP